jgi:hypothetical protein
MTGVTREALLAQLRPAFGGDTPLAGRFTELLAAAGVADKPTFSATEASAIAVALGDWAAREAEAAIAALEAIDWSAEDPDAPAN